MKRTNDFEQIGHKNLELLRFYISRDLSDIKDRLDSNDYGILGYFIASLVDILAVTFFGNDFNYLINMSVSNVAFRILIRILFIGFLIFLFVFISWAIKKYKISRKITRSQLGDGIVLKSEEIQETIDNFDNIACDGLLICQNYKERYEGAT